MYLSRLTQRRRRSSAPEVADSQVAVFRYLDVLRDQMLWYGSAVLLGLVGMATNPVPRGVPLSAVYLIVNSGFAIRYTRRDLRRVRSADDFASGLSVRVIEPGRSWQVYLFVAVVFIGWAYFDSAAIAGRFVVAFFAPDLIQAAMTRRAVARRERHGLDLYIHGDEVNAHLRSLPLDQRQPVATLRPLSFER